MYIGVLVIRVERERDSDVGLDLGCCFYYFFFYCCCCVVNLFLISNEV